MYGHNRSVVPVNPKNKVSILQVSEYPVSDKVEITVDPEISESLRLLSVFLNGAGIHL